MNATKKAFEALVNCVYEKVLYEFKNESRKISDDYIRLINLKSLETLGNYKNDDILKFD